MCLACPGPLDFFLPKLLIMFTTCCPLSDPDIFLYRFYEEKKSSDIAPKTGCSVGGKSPHKCVSQAIHHQSVMVMNGASTGTSRDTSTPFTLPTGVEPV